MKRFLLHDTYGWTSLTKHGSSPSIRACTISDAITIRVGRLQRMRKGALNANAIVANSGGWEKEHSSEEGYHCLPSLVMREGSEQQEVGWETNTQDSAAGFFSCVGRRVALQFSLLVNKSTHPAPTPPTPSQLNSSFFYRSFMHGRTLQESVGGLISVTHPQTLTQTIMHTESFNPILE